MRAIQTIPQGQSPELRYVLASGALKRIANEGFTGKIFRSGPPFTSSLLTSEITVGSITRKRTEQSARDKATFNGIAIGQTIFQFKNEDPPKEPTGKETQLSIQFPEKDKRLEEINEAIQSRKDNRGVDI